MRAGRSAGRDGLIVYLSHHSTLQVHQGNSRGGVISNGVSHLRKTHHVVWKMQ